MKLGDRMRDKITRFEGVAVSRCDYINGCVQFQLTAPALEGGKEISDWFDHQRLEVTEAGAYPYSPPSLESDSPPGGPGDHPPARHP